MALPQRRRPRRKSSNRSLSDQIIDNYALSKFDSEEKHFLPAGTLGKLVTKAAILKELECVPPASTADFTPAEDHDIKEITEFIDQKAKTSFAIAVVSGLHGADLFDSMLDLKEDGFTDSSLPMNKTTLEKYHSRDDQLWSRTRIHNFCQEQWKFLAPVFSMKEPKFYLEHGHILPIISKSDTPKEGAFGQVFAVEIHEAHQKDLVSDVSLFLTLNHLFIF